MYNQSVVSLPDAAIMPLCNQVNHNQDFPTKLTLQLLLVVYEWRFLNNCRKFAVYTNNNN